MANSARLEILNILKKAETTVEDLIKATGLKKSNISQHLTLLKHHSLVTAKKEGRYVVYKIVDPLIVAPCEILDKLRSKRRS